MSNSDNRHCVDDNAHLGGRLDLLAPAQLTPDQVWLRDRLTSTRIARAEDAGYQASLPDGRLIGPFNAFLRVPAIGTAQLDWAQAISAAGLPKRAAEVAVLTVAAQWNADYVLYAHRIAAASAGVSARDIDDLVAGRTPTGLPAEELLANRLAAALVRDHDVADDLYADVLAAYGEAGTVALTTLIGQYLATCALLTCFRVPGPTACR